MRVGASSCCSQSELPFREAHLIWVPVPNLELPLFISQPSASDRDIDMLVAANRVRAVLLEGESEL